MKCCMLDANKSETHVYPQLGEYDLKVLLILISYLQIPLPSIGNNLEYKSFVIILLFMTILVPPYKTFK
jgi:hypothetical protein